MEADLPVGLAKKLAELAEQLLKSGQRVTAAESCTGGLISAALTDMAGSSAWFEYGFVTYANHAKEALLGVPATLIEEYGAVSQPVVEAMVTGAVTRSGADLGVAVSGIAGPDGGSAEKPVGTVWISWQANGQPPFSGCFVFAGDRRSVRHQTVEQAIDGLLAQLEKTPGI